MSRRDVPPPRNLNDDAEPWGRHTDKRLDQIERVVERLTGQTRGIRQVVAGAADNADAKVSETDNKVEEVKTEVGDVRESAELAVLDAAEAIQRADAARRAADEAWKKAENKTANWSFEDGTENWTKTGPGTFIVLDDLAPYDGSYIGKVDATAGDTLLRSTYNNAIRIEPGQIWNVTIRARGGGKINPGVTLINEAISVEVFAGGEGYVTTGAQWASFSTRYTVPEEHLSRIVPAVMVEAGSMVDVDAILFQDITAAVAAEELAKAAALLAAQALEDAHIAKEAADAAQDTADQAQSTATAAQLDATAALERVAAKMRAGTNIITNGDFESGTVGWTGGSHVVNPTQSRSGTSCMAIVDSHPVSDPYTIAGERDIRVSFWVNRPVGQAVVSVTPELVVKVASSETPVIVAGTAVSPNASNVYTQSTQVLATPENAISVAVRFSKTGTGVARVDDVEATDVTDINSANAIIERVEDGLGLLEGAVEDAQTAATDANDAAIAAAGIANSKGRVIYQDSAPAGAQANATNLWIRTTDNKPHTYNGSTWVAVTDKAATDAATAAATANSLAASKITTYFSDTAPAQKATGDLWFDTSSGKILKRWDGSTWVVVQDEALQQALDDAADAHAVADEKVRTFAQVTAPTGMTTGDVGDLWVDTDDGNKLHRWSGTQWDVVQDAAITAAQQAAADAASAAASAAGIAGGKADVLIDSTAPAVAMRKSTTLWIDTTSNLNTPKRWNGSAWVAVTDKAATDAANAAAAAQTTATNAAIAAQDAQDAAEDALASAAAAQTTATTANDAAIAAAGIANSKGRVIYQATAPTGANASANNLWIRTTDNKPHTYNGTEWVVVTDKVASDAASAAAAANSLAASKITTYFSDTPPAEKTAGDLWFDTSDGKILKRWSGSAWTVVQDEALQQALDDAADAHAVADEKVRTFAQVTAPTGLTPNDVGDLWVDTDDGNKLYRWSGSQWEVMQDTAITAAQQAAADAATAAANAAGIAGGKADVLIQNTAPAAAMRKATTLWIDTTGGANTPKRWTTGTTWVAVTDKAATNAATAAANAQTTANNAVTAAQDAQDAAEDALADAAAAATAASTADTKAQDAQLIASAASGKIIYPDANFAEGFNGMSGYSLSPATSSRERIDAPADAPSTSGKIIRVTRSGTTSGFLMNVGGAGWNNRTAVMKLVAKVPIGNVVQPRNNSLGTDGQFVRVLGSNQGTGMYETYYIAWHWGSTGTTSTAGHISFTGPDAVIDIAFCTVYDVTLAAPDAQKALDTANQGVLLGEEALIGIDNAVADITASYSSDIMENVDQILSTVSAEYTAKTEFVEEIGIVRSEIDQTVSNIDLRFIEVTESVVDMGESLTAYQSEVATYIRFSSAGIELGKAGSPFVARLSETELAFMQSGKKVAFISNNKMHITDAEVRNNLALGTETTGFFDFIPRANGNLSFKYREGTS